MWTSMNGRMDQDSVLGMARLKRTEVSRMNNTDCPLNLLLRRIRLWLIYWYCIFVSSNSKNIEVSGNLLFILSNWLGTQLSHWVERIIKGMRNRWRDDIITSLCRPLRCRRRRGAAAPPLAGRVERWSSSLGPGTLPLQSSFRSDRHADSVLERERGLAERGRGRKEREMERWTERCRERE